jgi:transcriptional regulator with GAF, ATPase, and Fis domain
MADVSRIAQAFVELADTLVENFDVVDFLQTLTDRCVELAGTDASGLMLSDQRGGLQVMTATLQRARMLELFELQVQQGPCLDCFNSGSALTNVDLTQPETTERWPAFTPAAAQAGFGTTHALPMRLRGQVIGALNLFNDKPVQLSESDLTVAQAMADVATIGLLHQRNIHEKTVLSEQLQTALASRVLIEQAKGALATHLELDVDHAFQKLRAYARRNNLTLTDVATAIMKGAMSTDILINA